MTNEFLRDLDQWDEDSQGILLSLAEKDQLISVEEIEKGILGKGASLFEKVILNDDESNRMISPFYEKFDIADSPNSGKNIMLDTKVSEFNFTGKDENNQSTFAYQTIVHELPGSEVYKQYKTEKAGFDAHFLKLYYEKLNTERIFNFSGRFCLLNIGKTYYNNIISNFPNQGIVSYYGENKHSVYVNSVQSEVSYIKKVIDSVYANNQLSEKEILKALKLALWQYSPTGSIVNAIGNINDGMADAVSLLASGVGKLKIAESGYLPSESNYQPFLLKQANSSPTIASMGIGISILEQVIRKGMNSLEGYSDKINDAIPVGFRNAIREVTLFKNRLNEMIQAVMPILEDFGAEYFKLINAFVCGIINGLISLIEFIFQVISFGIGLDSSIKSYDDYAERQSYLEVMEEALDFLLKSVPELLNGILDLIKTVNLEDIENLLQLITGLLGNVTRYELAYYGGIIAFEIIIGVVLAILTGGTGNVAKAVGSSQKLIESLKIIGREFISSVTFGVSDLLAIFRNLIKSFVRACKNGFKGFLEWVRSLLKQDGRHLDDVLEDIEKTTINADEIADEINRWLLKNKVKYQELFKYGKELLERTAKTYAKKYPEGKLYKILKAREAYRLYGQLGKKLVQEVDNTFEKMIEIKKYKEKVMISGMTYKRDTNQKIFTSVNFTKHEIKIGKLKEFIENLHPVLKNRYELHLKQITKGLQATPEMIDRAGIAASHGEIRAINELLHYIEDTGFKVTDDIFNDLIGYNRFLIKEGSQPPCVHCFYLTDGVKYLKK